MPRHISDCRALRLVPSTWAQLPVEIRMDGPGGRAEEGSNRCFSPARPEPELLNLRVSGDVSCGSSASRGYITRFRGQRCIRRRAR
ncbi:hypothetical protein GE061_000735 [Apolygus lucorum]|uniref:Uncharacterized protein n=1 Tax=Apolygus lucorum TaxID=248454 RepID=A0A8S9Y5E4_APOLU|nr:hypothetical protein GE061_000735 [Apolygus lucorum]